jgi:hypothetical protein
LTVGEKKEIAINIHRDKMTETKDYESAIYIKVNDKIDTIDVVIHHFLEQKIHIESNVIDAEYSRKKEVMVYVANNPMKLYFFYTKTNVIESMDLNFVPTCISISPDQDYAVVGHDAHISYIDLNSKSIIRIYNVSCNVFDIVFGDNNWAYAFPKYDQSEHIRCINLSLSNNNETLHVGTSIYEKTKAKLHPKGKYIYATNFWGLEKISIQNGTAVYLYGGYLTTNTGNDLWFSEDGNRIFGASKQVYLTSEIQDQDMKYSGQMKVENFIDDYGKITSLDHSANKSNLYLIFILSTYYNDGQPAPFLYIYNASDLTFKDKIALEKYHVGNNQSSMKEYDAIPYFVFCNSIGDEVFIVTKAQNSGLEHEWAIEKIIINN